MKKIRIALYSEGTDALNEMEFDATEDDLDGELVSDKLQDFIFEVGPVFGPGDTIKIIEGKAT